MDLGVGCVGWFVGPVWVRSGFGNGLETGDGPLVVRVGNAVLFCSTMVVRVWSWETVFLRNDVFGGVLFGERLGNEWFGGK